jgi:O-antigen/teichoic acid export membrane protein
LIAFNAAAQVTALGLSLVVQTAYLILAARILGVDDFGRFSFVFSITQILLVGGDLGLHNTGLRKISAEPNRSRQIFPLFFSLKAMVSLGLFVIVAGIALLLRENWETRQCLLLLGTGMFFHSTALSLGIGYQAHGRLYLASLNSFLLILLQFVIGTTGLWLGGRLVWLGTAYLGAASVGLFINWLVFRKRIHEVKLVFPVGGMKFFVESLPVGLGNFFESAALRISYTLLAYLAGSYETGVYAAAARITGSLRNLPVGIFGAVLPVMASFQTSPNRVRSLFQRSFWAMLAMVIPVAFVLFWWSDFLISLLYGPSYMPASGLLRLLAVGLIPLFVGMSFSHVMLSQSRLLRRFPVVTGLALLFNILLNLILIPAYGSTGAAVTALLTEALMAILFALAVRHFLQRSVSDRGHA